MCGIFGILSSRKKVLDKKAFYTLGVNNDSRGGDACGIFIDGLVEYGTSDSNKYFANFYDESVLLKNKVICDVALGHCRKASIGGAKPELAQPCIIKNKKGKIDFAVLHNGTISNYLELAHKYIPEINIAGMSDSQIMTNIFYYAGYDVLTEYVGGGVFVIADYRTKEPTIYMYKGSSKKSSIAKEAEEERPLFYVQSRDSLIFSSISTYLFTLYYKETPFYVPCNKLLKYDKVSNTLLPVKIYDRSNLFQPTSYYNYGYNYNTVQSDYRENWGKECDCNSGVLPFYSSSKKENKEEKEENKSVNNAFEGVSINCCHIDCNLCTLKYELKMYGSSVSKIADGVFHLNKWGNITPSSVEGSIDVYFIEGIMISNKETYMYLAEFARIFGFSLTDLYNYYPEIVTYCSVLPSRNEELHEDTLLYTYDIDNDCYKLVNGNYVIPFKKLTLNVYEGISKLEDINNSDSSSSYDAGFNYLKKLMNKPISEKLKKYVEGNN